MGGELKDRDHHREWEEAEMKYTTRKRKQRGSDGNQVCFGSTSGWEVSFCAPWCIILKALNDSGTYCFKVLRLFISNQYRFILLSIYWAYSRLISKTFVTENQDLFNTKNKLDAHVCKAEFWNIEVGIAGKCEELLQCRRGSFTGGSNVFLFADCLLVTYE